MNRIILIFITFALCSSACYSQYDYSQYLRQAMFHLDNGDTVRAKDNYEAYTTMTGKTSPEFEKKLEALRRLKKNAQTTITVPSLSAAEMKTRGDDYYLGRNGVEKNYVEAVKWYRKSAEQGYADGQYNLGVMYENGCGIDKDYEEAVKWYRKSAEQGNAPGQCNLGYMYYHGYGVDKDYVEAAKWYRKSAGQGNAPGQYNLGDMYEYGKGVEKNLPEAIKWYRAAAKQGSQGAKKALKRLGVTE